MRLRIGLLAVLILIPLGAYATSSWWVGGGGGGGAGSTCIGADCVTGPSSAVSDTLAVYNGGTGKVIKSGGPSFVSGVLALPPVSGIGGAVTFQEGSDQAGGNTLKMGIQDATNLTASIDCRVGADGRLPIPCLSNSRSAADCTTQTGGVLGEECFQTADKSIYFCNLSSCGSGDWSKSTDGSISVLTFVSNHDLVIPGSTTQGGVARWSEGSGYATDDPLDAISGATVQYMSLTGPLTIDLQSSMRKNLFRFPQAAFSTSKQGPTLGAVSDGSTVDTPEKLCQLMYNTSGLTATAPGITTACVPGSARTYDPTTFVATPIACAATGIANGTYFEEVCSVL